jgi:hypothetical protein
VNRAEDRSQEIVDVKAEFEGQLSNLADNLLAMRLLLTRADQLGYEGSGRKR